MTERLTKPCVADNRFYERNTEYPEKVHETYDALCERLDNLCVEDVGILIEQIYKVAYLDGFEDAIYYKDI